MQQGHRIVRVKVHARFNLPRCIHDAEGLLVTLDLRASGVDVESANKLAETIASHL
jgi:hypothetical protein